MSASLTWPQPSCCHSGDWCVCGLEERALRGWIRGDVLPPMTPDQREYCLSEIGRVEGYSRADHETDTDADLARNVLSAWADYCRDKGLL